MIEKYFLGVIEQVYGRVGNTEKNIVIAKYSNDFSMRDLNLEERYSNEENNVFFVCHEFAYDGFIGAFEPFLDTICDMFRKYGDGNFSGFLEECETYYLQRPILESYFNTGTCEREENVLLNEVQYEQGRMVEAIVSILKKIAEKHPVMMVINRFQQVGQGSMGVIRQLLLSPSKNIGIVLGVNGSSSEESGETDLWASIMEMLEDTSHVYHLGTTGRRRAQEPAARRNYNYEFILHQQMNTIALLDLNLAKRYFQMIEHGIRFEDMHVANDIKWKLYLMYAYNSVLLGEMPKALELVEEVLHLSISGKEHEINYYCAYLIATCNMYQGKLENAVAYAKMAKYEAMQWGREKEEFLADLLLVQSKMSGWYNIFFCVQDITISETLFEKLIKYNYKNHMAHVYIYAYDNRPEVVAKAYRSEAALFYFSKGVALAKEIGNAQLVYAAYQKNIMIASTNGMNEIALLYSVRTYQFMKGRNLLYDGRTLCGLGYNLSALGHNERAEEYYNRAIEIFYKLNHIQDIAEVYYNRALNSIMLGHYEAAEADLQLSMKVIERLHLNSLRVCNLSKLYALLALSCILQGDQFSCERYLLSCRQFLNYIIAKEKENENAEIIHDYALCDDDMFLYTFSKGLLSYVEGNNDKAFSLFEEAEIYLARAEGNQFFVYRIFRQQRMALYKAMGRNELYERESFSLQQHDELFEQLSNSVPLNLLNEIHMEVSGKCRIPEADIDRLIKQEGLQTDYQVMRKQMEFISAWQKIIDITDVDIKNMVTNAIHTFLNHFSTDRALYIWYEGKKPKVLYNDTRVEMTPEIIASLENSMKEYPQGFAVSKITDTFFEHQDAITYFGEDEVCSFVAAPFFKNGKLTSLLITYVRMKDNWHSSIDRYMLNEDDLQIYQMLFRELNYSINRLEATQKVREMNRKLQAAASTDMLTGIFNRVGMYEEIHRRMGGKGKRRKGQGVGLMFIDLDNFKHYNDRYGHDVGDLILKEMAQIFVRSAKNNGFVSRFGGDEFIIILDSADKVVLENIAKDIYKRIKKTNGFRAQIERHLGHEIEVDEGRMITCSIGIAMAMGVKDEDGVNELIKKADDILYTVKTGEKGHYAFL